MNHVTIEEDLTDDQIVKVKVLFDNGDLYVETVQRVYLKGCVAQFEDVIMWHENKLVKFCATCAGWIPVGAGSLCDRCTVEMMRKSKCQHPVESAPARCALDRAV